MDDYDMSMDDYDRIHRLEEELARAHAEVAKVRQEIEEFGREVDKRITDIEARTFANRCEIEMDLERWDGIYAAHVGHELEDIADRLIDAMGANRRGDDIEDALFNLHVDVCCLMADISTGEDDG